jgi:hypothetical protein
LSNQKIKSSGGDPSRPAAHESSVEQARDRLAGLLPDDALQDALKGLEPEEITGPGGLLTQLAGRVIETALGAELSEHLGYPPGQAPPGGAGNHRNGHIGKTLRTELGPSKSARRAIARAALRRGWSASARRGWRAWTRRSSACTPAA